MTGVPESIRKIAASFVTELGVPELIKELVDPTERFFPSLNTQRDVDNGGWGDTGVNNAGVIAAYIRDVRHGVFHVDYTHYNANDIGGEGTTRFPTSESHTFWVNRIHNMLQEENKPVFDDPVFAALWDTGIVARKAIDISVFFMGCMDYVFGRTLTNDITDRYPLVGTVEEEDIAYRGMSINHNQRTYDRGCAWIQKCIAAIKNKFPEIAGVFKPFLLAYRWCHRISKVAIPFEGVHQGRHKRSRWLISGFPNASINSLLSGTGQEHFDPLNGEIHLGRLYQVIMSDVTDYDRVAKYVPSIKQMMEAVDPLVEGMAMWKGVRNFERFRDENLNFELSHPYILVDHSDPGEYLLSLFGNGEDMDWYVYWFGKDKPTWFSGMHIMFPPLDPEAGCHCAVFEARILPSNCVILDMDDVTGVDHMNVYTISHMQINAGVGANALPAFGWVECADNIQIRYAAPLLFSLVHELDILETAFHNAYNTPIDDIVNDCVSEVIQLYMTDVNFSPIDGELIFRAVVPLSQAELLEGSSYEWLKTYLGLGGRGFGGFKKNVMTLPYGSSSEKLKPKKFGSSKKSTGSRRTSDAPVGDTKPEPENKLGAGSSDGYIPPDQWSKMSPEDKKKTIESRK